MRHYTFFERFGGTLFSVFMLLVLSLYWLCPSIIIFSTPIDEYMMGFEVGLFSLSLLFFGYIELRLGRSFLDPPKSFVQPHGNGYRYRAMVVKYKFVALLIGWLHFFFSCDELTA